MAFIYDEQRHRAIDLETGETITGPHGYTDIGGVLAYNYNRPDDLMPLIYMVSFFDSYRQQPVLDIKHPFDITSVEIYLAELRDSYYHSRVYIFSEGPDLIGKPPGTSGSVLEILAKWDAFRQRVAEGTLTLVAKNGDPSSWFPHYHVKWVERLPNY